MRYNEVINVYESNHAISMPNDEGGFFNEAGYDIKIGTSHCTTSLTGMTADDLRVIRDKINDILMTADLENMSMFDGAKPGDPYITRAGKKVFFASRNKYSVNPINMFFTDTDGEGIRQYYENGKFMKNSDNAYDIVAKANK